MRLLVFIFIFLITQNRVQAQDEHRNIAFFAGIASNAPIFGVQNEAYDLRYDSKYLWLSPSIGIESFLKKTTKSTFIAQLKYQVLPHASMNVTKAESTENGIYTREFDSLIMKSDNVRFSIGVKHYFSEAYQGFYLQYNAGLNLIFNKTSVCSCTRTESVDDNYFSETGTYYSGKRKVLMPELSFTAGRVFKLNKQFSLDAGVDVGMPFGRMQYPFVLEQFPSFESRTKMMNLNAFFLTSLIELHVKLLIIK